MQSNILSKFKHIRTGFEGFNKLFVTINCQRGAFAAEGELRFRVIDNKDILGLETLWSFVLDTPDAVIVEAAISLLRLCFSFVNFRSTFKKGLMVFDREPVDYVVFVQQCLGRIQPERQHMRLWLSCTDVSFCSFILRR